MNKTELSLLLYFEDCAVNQAGRVDSKRMNDEDREIAQRWNNEGFVLYGRIASEGCSPRGSNWCKLSEDAWEKAAGGRKARAARVWDQRNWETTEEKRSRE